MELELEQVKYCNNNDLDDSFYPCFNGIRVGTGFTLIEATLEKGFLSLF